jgi:cell division septal protein FtsQ
MAFLFRKRSLIQSQKLLRRERALWWVKVVSIFLLMVALLWGLSTLSFLDKLNVKNIKVSGNSAVPTSEVLSVAQNILRGRNFLIFSSANIFWYPKKEIIDTLQYSYAWIDYVSINRVGFDTIEIKIKERVPVAVWCGVSVAKKIPCRLVDWEGYIFAKAPEFSGSAYLKLYGTLTSANWRGASFFSQNGLDHILDLTKALSEIGFEPVSVAVAGNNAYDVFNNSGAKISVLTTEAISNIISNIDSLFTQKVFAESQASNFSNLMYIDTRFGNKLFYKFKATSTNE